jgi:ubiquinone/menaquinone biosynthesis C-methylase UbiE
MTAEIYQEIREGVRVEEEARLVYTRQAYHMIPEIISPRILDIGCGRGQVTLELARLSKGDVVGLDINQASLDELIHKAEEMGFSDRVRAVNRSMLDMGFPDDSFDILWTEGSIFVVGFRNGLTAWKRYLRSGGFLVVHEMTWLQDDPPGEILDHWAKIYPGITTASENIDIVSECGFELIDHFLVPESVWWHDYYGPLETLILQLREKYAMDQEALRVLEKEQREVDLYRKYSKWYGSAFYVMRKPASN